MNKAPDTRGKLDSNAGIKKRKRKETRFTMSEFKEAAPLVKLGVSPENSKRKPKKLTKGEEFKRTHGFSKSMARAMRRNGITVPTVVEGYGIEVTWAYENYIALRKKKRQEAKAARKKKAVSVKVIEPIKAKKKK